MRINRRNKDVINTLGRFHARPNHGERRGANADIGQRHGDDVAAGGGVERRGELHTLHGAGHLALGAH